MYVALVSATSQISSVNVTSRRPPTLQRRFLLTVSTPLHEELPKAKSQTSTRSRFKLPPSKTAASRNSVLPALSRLLVDRNAELNYYIQELS